jgi:hypothetical protein
MSFVCLLAKEGREDEGMMKGGGREGKRCFGRI